MWTPQLCWSACMNLYAKASTLVRPIQWLLWFNKTRCDALCSYHLNWNSATTKSVSETKRFLIEFWLIWYQRHIVFSEHRWVKPICHRTDHCLWDINTVITQFWQNVYLLCFDFKCMMVNRWSQCTYFAIS